jgi:hypothetical protein
MLESADMAAAAERFFACMRLRPVLWFRVVAWIVVLAWITHAGLAHAQSARADAGNTADASSVHGTVLNGLTNEPIGGALVYSFDQQYAALTDDHGHFEFKFPPRKPEQTAEQDQTSTPEVRMFQAMGNYPPTAFLARKPGFLQNPNNQVRSHAGANQFGIMIYLYPESLINGRVSFPDSEGDLRVRLELFRHQTVEGQEQWVPVGSFRTWADGEFRFFNLKPGTYKLVTDEQIDRNPGRPIPGEQIFGFPPTFYSGASDSSGATPIQLAAGATFQADLSVSRRAYYSVKIPVANLVAGQAMSIRVYPLGSPGPGYSLAYNPGLQVIQGMLPDGNYTVQAETSGEHGSTGMVNLSVHGETVEGGALNLIPNSAITVNLREEFKSSESNFQENADENGKGQTPREWRGNVHVSLTPIEEFAGESGAWSQPVDDSQQHALIIQNVHPGRYRVNVQTGAGYAAEVVAGETDLLRQPLVVGLGGSNSPIEVTLRDDGAEVDGTLKDATKTDRGPEQDEDAQPSYYVYFLPVTGSGGQFREMFGLPDGSFRQEQLPPGTYHVLAFDREQDDLVGASEETLRKFVSAEQLIEVAPGQKESLSLKVISGDDLR